MTMARASILLLEDDPDIRDLLTDVFTDEGYAVQACATVEDVRQARVSGDVAVAVLDAWGESQTVLSEVERREIEEVARAIPTIMVTGRQWATTTIPDELGLLGLLPKPFDLGELVAFVKASIEPLLRDSARAQEEARQLQVQVREVQTKLRETLSRLKEAGD